MSISKTPYLLFHNFSCFGCFFGKKHEKAQSLLFRVLFRLIKKVTHLSKALQLKKYIKSTLSR